MAVALAPDEARLGQIRVRGLVVAGRESAVVGGGLERAGLGDRGHDRAGPSARAAAAGAGEQVLDVQPKLAARVRPLNTGTVNKNDPTTRDRLMSPRCDHLTFALSRPRITPR